MLSITSHIASSHLVRILNTLGSGSNPCVKKLLIGYGWSLSWRKGYQIGVIDSYLEQED